MSNYHVRLYSAENAVRSGLDMDPSVHYLPLIMDVQTRDAAHDHRRWCECCENMLTFHDPRSVVLAFWPLSDIILRVLAGRLADGFMTGISRRLHVNRQSKKPVYRVVDSIIYGLN